ncbi:MAG: CocE/NonD family hydrolase, partial [Microthrixaceae bacterium]|nr:CocE/NonD family hydrolase [Microthrixaceae bacterium]
MTSPIRPRRRLLTGAIAVLAALCLVSSCSGSKDASTTTQKSSVADVDRLASDAAKADFTVMGSLNQVAVTHAEPKSELALFDSNGEAVDTATADSQGSHLFRLVEPGEYRVGTVEKPQKASAAVKVIDVAASIPEQSFYSNQKLVKGFQYITTRDGTTLSTMVTLPGPIEDGPYPTVVEYSGYSPSKPASNLIKDRWDDISKTLPEGLSMDAVCALAAFACEAPDQPASLIASALGYAVVSVNMRGTGCSGGAYDFFEPLQLTDGYDVIETAAAQPWVLNNKVGMVGLSYPGISQLFVGSTEPPSLAAITPLSVYDDTARGVLAPGGIFNQGFALTWAEEVLDGAKPYGQGWEEAVVDDGDEVCAENQLLRGQNVDAVAKAKDNPYYVPSVADPLNPSLFVDRINVPVFLAGAFQDEQTGGRFPLLFNSFTNAPVTKFSAWNGAHADGFQPANVVEWKTFLDFYVRGELTERPLAAELFLPLIAEEVFGKQMSLPAQRMFEQYPSFEAKRAAYEAEPSIRLRLESGAGDPANPGLPDARWDFRTDAWPLENTEATPFYFAEGGKLTSKKPSGDEDSYSTFKVTPKL